MNDVLVSIDLTSTALNLVELQRLAGCAGSEGSIDRDQPGPGNMRFRRSRLRVSSTDRSVDIAQQIEAIAAKLHDANLDEAKNEIHISLDIALFVSTATGTVEIPLTALDQLPIRPVEIAVSFYPCADDET